MLEGTSWDNELDRGSKRQAFRGRTFDLGVERIVKIRDVVKMLEDDGGRSFGNVDRIDSSST